jgi:tetratricopeptide (TPR) repeat protein
MHLRFNARILAGVFFSLLLAGCATPPQTAALLGARPQHLPERTELEHVVYFPQEAYQCGPASLAMALHESGAEIKPEELGSFTYIPEKRGSLQAEMLAAARRQGRVAYVLRPELEDILMEIAGGNPVIVLQNLALSWYPMWHYAVAIGYDFSQRELILRSGRERRQRLPLMTFEHTWARGKRWAMLVLPPGKLPQTATPENYILALSALEHSSPQTDAWPGYEAAIRRWPDNLAAQIGAGNAAYRRGDLAAAEQYFLRAQQDHPDSAAASNNLAQVQGELGKYEEALVSAGRAVGLGGPLEAAARKTLEEIRQKMGSSVTNQK